jgi:putative PIN family toxin of toxin-antitoxin system
VNLEIELFDSLPLIVLDTNVLVAGLCRRVDSPSYKILRSIQNGEVSLVLTHKLFLEYESVLKRDKIRQLIEASEEEISMVLDTLVVLAQPADVFYLWRPNLVDEGDNFVLEAAVSTGALLITKNIKDFRSGELKFPDLTVLTPGQFCQLYLP